MAAVTQDIENRSRCKIDPATAECIAKPEAAKK
jgi:hypothetical protein